MDPLFRKLKPDAYLGGEDGLIVGSLLHVGHHIVHVLRGGQAALLTLVVHPHVLPGA